MQTSKSDLIKEKILRLRKKQLGLLARQEQIKEEMFPDKPRHIVSQLHRYLAEMRTMGADVATSLMDVLDLQVKEYFEEETDIQNLKIMAVELTDELYKQIAALEVRDVYTNGYFGIVLNRFYTMLSSRGILCFFVLDNSLRDDRFKMAVELFHLAGFDSIYPYVVDGLEYFNDYTRLPVKDYKSVEKGIDGSKANKHHIFYVEKDDSVNCLGNVLHLAEEFQSEYVCILRNTAPDDDSKARWLMGSFGDILNS